MAASVALGVLRLPTRTAEDTPGELVLVDLDGDGDRHSHKPASAHILDHRLDVPAREGCGEELGVSEQACVHSNELRLGRRAEDFMMMCLWYKGRIRRPVRVRALRRTL
jgi:hypothetical protein